MDLVIDDGSHTREGNSRTISALWRLVRPGGLYVIEDVSTGADTRGKYGAGGHNDRSGFASIVHAPDDILRDVYNNNDVFFADTLVGVDFEKNAWIKQSIKTRWIHDKVDHNGHLIVIRKRT